MTYLNCTVLLKLKFRRHYLVPLECKKTVRRPGLPRTLLGELTALPKTSLLVGRGLATPSPKNPPSFSGVGPSPLTPLYTGPPTPPATNIWCHACEHIFSFFVVTLHCHTIAAFTDKIIPAKLRRLLQHMQLSSPSPF